MDSYIFTEELIIVKISMLYIFKKLTHFFVFYFLVDFTNT